MKKAEEIKKGLEWDEVDEALRKISLDDVGESDMRKPKTSADIKKGLQCCLGDTHAYHCDECPYSDDESDVDDGCGDNGIQLLEDALELIQQLEAENDSLKFTKATDADVHRYQKAEMKTIIHQLESKLNQAVEDIRLLGRTGEFNCPVCAYYNNGKGIKGECVKCLTGDGFRWRGETDEKAAD